MDGKDKESSSQDDKDNSGQSTAKGKLTLPNTKIFLYGVKVPAFFLGQTQDAIKHIQNLRAMEIRDDILFLAYPRCGTHWLYEMVHMLMKQKAEIGQRTKEHLMLEFGDPSDFDKEVSPRLLNSHMTMVLLPQQAFEKKVKIVHVYRNPKDTVISLYHAANDLFPGQFTFQEFLTLYMDDEPAYGHQMKYLRRFSQFLKDHPDYPVIHIRYEDLKKEPEKNLKDVADFLGFQASDEFIKEVVDACEFNKMKKAEAGRYKPERLMKYVGETNYDCYRQGHSGGWKNVLTVAQNEEMDAFIAREGKDLTDFTFVYQ